jgi:Raf kinase inhibitor-like YbhB/YbcL family protein
MELVVEAIKTRNFTEDMKGACLSSITGLQKSSAIIGGKALKKLDVKLDFKEFPARFTCDGENISPRLMIGRTDAKALAIILEDPDASSGTFTHWIAWNIDPLVVLAENIPKDAKVDSQSELSRKEHRKSHRIHGSMPPRGKAIVISSSLRSRSQIDLPPGADRNDLEGE